MRYLLETIPAPLLIALIVGGSALLAVGLTYFIRRKVQERDHIANTEVAGSMLGVVGTVYGVLLAFLVLIAWQAFEAAEVNVEQEANTLVNIYRLAQELPEPHGTQVRSQTVAYTHAVIDDEWNQMALGQESIRVRDVLESLWELHLEIHQANQESVGHEGLLFRALETLGNQRRIRLLESRQELPTLLWILLIAGAIVTIGFTLFLRAPNWIPHLLMAALFAGLIAFVLFLIVELDNPFSGDVSIQPFAFRQALQLFERLSPN